MKKRIEDKFNIGDWILLPHTVEPEMYLQLDISNVEHYNKVKLKEGVSGPRRASELEVNNFYEEKILEHREEASFASMMVETYKYKLLDLKNEK